MNYLYTTIMYINVLWTQMSRQWMYMADRRSKEFINGVHEFIEAVEKYNYIHHCSVQIVHSYYQFITNIEYAINKTELQNYNDAYGLLTA